MNIVVTGVNAEKMAKNKMNLRRNSAGKKFEQIIRESFESVSNVSIDRVHDQTTKYKGSKNICDFIVYKEPYEYYIECKTVKGNVLPFANITDAQWDGLLQKSRIQGVNAGVICWWRDRDITKFIPIQFLEVCKNEGAKSIRYDYGDEVCTEITGRKRRMYFEYDMQEFLEVMEDEYVR